MAWYFMLYRAFAVAVSFLEVCIGLVRLDTFHQVRVDVACRNGCPICAEIRIRINDFR